jgi:hypothetical protein
MDLCSDREWYCLSGGDIQFAVPTRCCREKTWSHRSVDYTLISDDAAPDTVTVWIAGCRGMGWVGPLTTKIYRYSKKRGLVGILMHLSIGDGNLYPAMYVLRERT